MAIETGGACGLRGRCEQCRTRRETREREGAEGDPHGRLLQPLQQRQTRRRLGAWALAPAALASDLLAPRRDEATDETAGDLASGASGASGASSAPEPEPAAPPDPAAQRAQTTVEVAAYYFPNYHRDPRNDRWYGPGWTEWELVKTAQPRFPGHRQPIVPAWGYFDEADPRWTAREIDLAAGHGVTCFLYDWYWYEDGPYLHDALEQGFLKAPNTNRLKFALMWANHDWLNIQPARTGRPPELLMPGAMSRAGFERLTDYVVERYFTRPNYLTLDGQPYFSIYEVGTFIKGIGGIEAAREALDRFRAKVRAAGFPDLHLNGIVWGVMRDGGAGGEGRDSLMAAVPETVRAALALGVSSVGSYTWIHHLDGSPRGFPRASYSRTREQYADWRERCERLPVTYVPNVTMGWDSSPRTHPADPFEPFGYPWMAVLEGNTPDVFRAALERAKAYALRRRPDGGEPAGQKLVTLNAWNEWTEGSYLLPDTVHGTAYLEAVREVFGGQSGAS
ncbi:MAG: glycoside hydrolase family 99-like domain-containing protein [Chloroflexi bacterium]|nr:glycoside hydrolase family 99-like domain-containing protein [Chloroflexota bacterium]